MRGVRRLGELFGQFARTAVSMASVRSDRTATAEGGLGSACSAAPKKQSVSSRSRARRLGLDSSLRQGDQVCRREPVPLGDEEGAALSLMAVSGRRPAGGAGGPGVAHHGGRLGRLGQVVGGRRPFSRTGMGVQIVGRRQGRGVRSCVRLAVTE